MKSVTNKAHNISRILYGVSPPPPIYYTDSGFDNDHKEITRNGVDVNVIVNSNRKQAHQSHAPHYEKWIEFFVKLYSIINKNIF
jgi:hypothetical protein